MSDHHESASAERDRRAVRRSPPPRREDTAPSSRSSTTGDSGRANTRGTLVQSDGAEHHSPDDGSPRSRYDYGRVTVARVSLLELDELQAPIDDPVTNAAHPLPWQPSSVVITSPRSLEACRACGVDPKTELNKYSLKYFLRMKGEGSKTLANRRFERSVAKREQLMARLIAVRQQLIDAAAEDRSAAQNDGDESSRAKVAAAAEREEAGAGDHVVSEGSDSDEDHDDDDLPSSLHSGDEAAHHSHRDVLRAQQARHVDLHDPSRVTDEYLILTAEMVQQEMRRDAVRDRRERLEAMRCQQALDKEHKQHERLANAAARKQDRALVQLANGRSRSVGATSTGTSATRHDIAAERRHAIEQHRTNVALHKVAEMSRRSAAVGENRSNQLEKRASTRPTATAADRIAEASRRRKLMQQQKDEHALQLQARQKDRDDYIAGVHDQRASGAWRDGSVRDERIEIARERRQAMEAMRQHTAELKSQEVMERSESHNSSRGPAATRSRRTRDPDAAVDTARMRREAINAHTQSAREAAVAARAAQLTQDRDERRIAELLRREEIREREEDRREHARRLKRAVEYLETKNRGHVA